MLEQIKINRDEVIKALLSYTHTPKDYLKQIYNLSNKDLLFHLENFCLLCRDNYNEILIKYNCINNLNKQGNKDE